MCFLSYLLQRTLRVSCAIDVKQTLHTLDSVPYSVLHCRLRSGCMMRSLRTQSRRVRLGSISATVSRSILRCLAHSRAVTSSMACRLMLPFELTCGRSAWCVLFLTSLFDSIHRRTENIRAKEPVLLASTLVIRREVCLNQFNAAAWGVTKDRQDDGDVCRTVLFIFNLSVLIYES